jgi:hypothetical protein
MNALAGAFAAVSTNQESAMRTIKRLAAASLLLGLVACAATGSPVPQEQAAQYQQAGGPFPYNSFYCP